MHVLQFGGFRTSYFLRDKLGLKATDIGEGWLIFDIRKQTWVAILQMKPTVLLQALMIFLFTAMILNKP